MKRRPPTKKHIGEVQLGFYTYIHLRENLGESVTGLVEDTLHRDVENELDAPPIGAFWGPNYFELFICPMGRSATVDDQNWMDQRLRQDVNVASWKIGPLIDAWHDDSFDEYWDPHPCGPWTHLVYPSEKWWKQGQPPGWMAIVFWTMQQMVVRALLQSGQGSNTDPADRPS